jgi:23S rRNA (uridine2552-2'-O)-methyltransferase
MSNRLGRKFADSYTKRAMQQGYPARSVFKLMECDQRFRILKPKLRVLDLGCVPGRWVMSCAAWALQCVQLHSRRE